MSYNAATASSSLTAFETPFSDTGLVRESSEWNETTPAVPDLESPFSFEFEAGDSAQPVHATDFVQLLAEMESPAFRQSLYDMAAEMEESWSARISNETAMGERFEPFARQEAFTYLSPVLNETEQAIEKVRYYFSGNDLASHNEAAIDQFFDELETGSLPGPAQEQFFKSIVNKVKSVVKTGVNLAKKGISAVGKILPIGKVLEKIKGMVRPLLERVLKYALGKLPASLRPHAANLAKRFLNIESETAVEDGSMNELEAIETEFNSNLAQSLFTADDQEASGIVYEYEQSAGEQPAALPSLDAARQQLMDDLRQGERIAPAIEKFLPAAILALQPVVKIAVSIIGRQRLINYLSGLLAKLIEKYVPQQVVKPLAGSIIDVGLSAIGFETSDRESAAPGYEALVNTIQETVEQLNESAIQDESSLAAATLSAFEKAAANNFPADYLRRELQVPGQQGTWIMMPRNGAKYQYKKYSRVTPVTIEPAVAKHIMSFGGQPLAMFLRDQLGLDPAKPIQAKVHLYEAIPGTRLSQIAAGEKNIPGLSVLNGYLQLHPLDVKTAALLLKEGLLGADLPKKLLASRIHIGSGQRFYFLEIDGARLRTMPSLLKKSGVINQSGATTKNVPVQPSDIQGVVNFVKAEIRINYYFSETESSAVVEKLNKSDFFGAANSIRQSVGNVLNDMLLKNAGSKVKIIHESIPELYVDHLEEKQDQFMGAIGKEAIAKIVEKLIGLVADSAVQGMLNYFRARAAEFRQAQSDEADGVTVKMIFPNIPGMSKIGSVLKALKGSFSLAGITDFSMPSIPVPDVQVKAGKQFD